MLAENSNSQESGVPIVSVVIPCYNHGAYLPETLASVAEQTFDDYEVIIVNDGSTDSETLNFLSHLDNSKTRVITTSNRGVSAARNRAIGEALGDYILPLDADDKIAPDYLEKASAILDEQPDVAIVYCDQMMFGEREGLLSLPDYNRQRLLVENLLHASAVFRKTVWKEVGGFSETMICGWEDWDFWIAVSRLDRGVVKLDEPLFYYRIREDSRDNTMGVSRKLTMFSLMVWHHKALYAKNITYVIRNLFAHSIKRFCVF